MKIGLFGYSSLIAAMAVILLAPAVPAAERMDRQNADGIGVLLEIRTDGVIINDVFRRLAPGVAYKNPDGEEQPPESFHRGDRVAFVKDDQGRIAVMWHLPEKELERTKKSF